MTDTQALGGLIQMGARPYAPGLGRFLEVDPIEGGSANDYDYVSGEPVNRFDLDGTLDAWICKEAFGKKTNKNKKKWAACRAQKSPSARANFSRSVKAFPKSRSFRVIKKVFKAGVGCFTGSRVGGFFGGAAGALVAGPVGVPIGAALGAVGGCGAGAYGGAWGPPGYSPFK